MTVNLFILFVALALTIAAGWLTVRAARARRRWVKIAGGLGAALLTLLFGALTVLGGRGFAIVYFPGADPAPDLAVAGTPEQIARGEYLSNISCLGCHGSFPDGFTGDPQPPLVGGVDMAAEEGLGIVGQLATVNLTPGGKLADYSDGEIFRALRHGLDSEGRRLGFMSLVAVGEFSDDDLEAVIAYMRSLPPATTDGPTGDRLSYVGLLFYGAGMLPTPDPRPDTIAAPPAGPSPDYGEYVATIGDCRGCHGPDMTGTPASALGPAVPNPRPIVKSMSVDQFHDMMRTGIRPGSSPFPDTMPWRNASQMSDEDLTALYAYLTTAP